MKVRSKSEIDFELRSIDSNQFFNCGIDFMIEITN